jgi:ATP-dependent Clp protease, protease subunit
MAKKSTDEISNFFDYGIDFGQRTLYLGSAAYTNDDDETGVDFLMADRLIKGLHLLEKSAPNGDKPIIIIMNNPGGDVVHGMACYDYIKACKNHVTIKVYGNVCSMGSYILQAADCRQMAPNSVFMFHEGYDSYSTNHPAIIDRWRDFWKTKYNKMLDTILLDAINHKRTAINKPPMTYKQFIAHNVFDTVLTAKEALEWGFIDEIV